MERAEELLHLLESEQPDHDRCCQLIREIGGCTQTIVDRYGSKTTPLHMAVDYGHLTLALSMIRESGADLDAAPEGDISVIWDLQYLDAEREQEQWQESAAKLQLLRAMIALGADPDPRDCGERLLDHIRYKVNESEGQSVPEMYHLLQMEHIIEARTYGETARFFEKCRQQAIERVMLSDFGFWQVDDRLCHSDHAVFVFEDGERMALSYHQTEQDEWDFYAVPVRADLWLDPARHHTVAPREGKIGFVSCYRDAGDPHMHWLDLAVDDALLRIHADEVKLLVGIVDRAPQGGESSRRSLFEQD